MTQGKILEGVFAVNKPTGPTSAAVLNQLQDTFNPSALFAPWIQNEKDMRLREHHNQRNKRRMKKTVHVKIGHGGTLDPLATGVLVTAIGKGTKSLQKYLECTKEYEAIVVFGTATDTYDRVGKVVKRAPYEHITRELVEEKLNGFKGKMMQLPPLYSAIKMNGKPLYEYARENKALPRPVERRPVECLELEMTEWMEPGTHNHKAPEEMMGAAEMKYLQKMWANEGIAPTTSSAGKGSEKDEKDRLELFERRKRKMSEEHDALVRDAPPQKVRRASQDQDTTMSGGLADPESTNAEPSAPAAASSPLVADEAAIESRPATPTKSKGPPAARIRMVVTSGFYVRSLCHELGPAVGSAACMAELQRTRQGEWEIGKNVVEYDDLMKDEEIWGPKVEALLDGWEDTERESRRLAHLASLKVRKGQDGERAASSQSEVKPAQEQKMGSQLGEQSSTVPMEESLKVGIVGESGQQEPIVNSEKALESEVNAEPSSCTIESSASTDKPSDSAPGEREADDKKIDKVVQPVTGAIKSAVDAVSSA